jgi:phosphatidylserine decarboxylase
MGIRLRLGPSLILDSAILQPFSTNLVSARVSTQATGSVQVKLGFVSTANTRSLMDFDEVFTELVKRSRPSLVSAPPVRILHLCWFNLIIDVFDKD